MKLDQIDKSAWRKIAFLLTVIASGCSGFLTWMLSNGQGDAALAGGLLGGLIVGPLIVLLGSVSLKLNDMRRQIKRQIWQSHASLREMTNIRPLVDGPPLDFGEWAVDPYFGKVLAQLISRHQPEHLLECGSGTSTVLMAQLQHRFCPDGELTALEHLSKYAEESNQLLEDHGVAEQVEVVLAPLEEWEVDGVTRPWYGVDVRRFSEQSIDMLVVDGPPGSTGPMARYPAAVLLKPYLSSDCVIVMDDGDRPDEKETARRWSELLEAEIEYAGGPKGTVILRREASSDKS